MDSDSAGPEILRFCIANRLLGDPEAAVHRSHVKEPGLSLCQWFPNLLTIGITWRAFKKKKKIGTPRVHATLDQNVCGREPGSNIIKDSQMIPMCRKARELLPWATSEFAYDDSQSWVPVRSSWGAFNHLLKPGTHPDQLNQNLWGLDLNVFKALGWF